MAGADFNGTNAPINDALLSTQHSNNLLRINNDIVDVSNQSRGAELYKKILRRKIRRVLICATNAQGVFSTDRTRTLKQLLQVRVFLLVFVYSSCVSEIYGKTSVITWFTYLYCLLPEHKLWTRWSDPPSTSWQGGFEVVEILFSTLMLSRRFLSELTLGAVTNSSGRSFHNFVTLSEKHSFEAFFRARSSKMFKHDPLF